MTAKALAGWKREQSRHGIVLTLQLAGSADEFRNKTFEKVDIALNERQLRSLARDLTRAAHERGMDTFARRPWWKLRWR